MADLLVVEDLAVEYRRDAEPARAVDGVSFRIDAGEMFGLVGESGSGKSTLAQALLRLLLPPAVITRGRVRFQGRDLLAAGERELRAVRGRGISLVPQSSMNALNPLVPVGGQLANVLRAHEPLRRTLAMERAGQLLELVGIERERASSFPHELSGGMRQRVVIALALARRPALLVMDESTAALDVVVQKELLTQIAALQSELGFSILFISHDLTLTLALCARVGVLYGGRLVETATAEELGQSPLHPYTQALLACSLDPRRPSVDGLHGIPGNPPDPRHPPSGCPFHPRCPQVFERCLHERPLLLRQANGRESACHLTT